MQPESPAGTTFSISRRRAIRAGAAAGAIGVGLTSGNADSVRATPARMQTEHLEVLFTPVDPVSITLAGGGPPQRGDHFYVDGAIYAVGDVNGVQIGTYQCFGAWTAAADDVDAPNQRLTTVQFQFEDGAIMGLINELGTRADDHVGAIQGGTGRYAGALGTFQQVGEPEPEPSADATPGAPGIPEVGQIVVRAVFDLILPSQS